MSYSDIIGSIAGLLQFAVGCYALRVSRVFGVTRVGWLFFAAFSLQALLHTLLSVHPFGLELTWGSYVNFLYEVICVLLLGSIGQVEVLIQNRGRKEKVELQSQDETIKLKEQAGSLTAANDELQKTIGHLRAENYQQKQAFELAEKTHQEQLAAVRQAEEELRAAAGSLQTELIEQQQVAEQTSQPLQDQIAALSKTEAQLRQMILQLEADLERERQLRGLSEKTFQEQLAAALQHAEELSKAAAAASAAPPVVVEPRGIPPVPATVPAPAAEEIEQPQSDTTYEHVSSASLQAEERLRSAVASLRADAAEQRHRRELAENACRELLGAVRQSGINEVALMTQSRVNYINRITKVMREHGKKLGSFITRDPRGKQLPISLNVLVEHLSDEQYLLMRRIDLIRKKAEQVRQSGIIPQDAPPVNPVEAISLAPAHEPFAPPPPVAENFYPVPETLPAQLVESVTETGTESPQAEPVPQEPATAPLPPDTEGAPAFKNPFAF